MQRIDPGLDDLFSVTYEELRRLAASVRRDDPGATLNPTTLVHEAYLKLSASLRLQPESRLHFKRLAARAMRQVLVEAARRRNALKRGGDQVLVAFDDAMDIAAGSPEELTVLDGALQELARVHPRQAHMVECRFFGGLEMREIAELLQVSESTLLRDWRAARAWLAIQLRNTS
jgi:RNA polymerase sigma factor (TIGR02999 family)